MKRRDFFKTLLGTAAAVAVGPKVLDLVKPVPGACVPAHVSTWLYESQFIIPPEEIADWLMMRTVTHWKELTLKNLNAGWAGLAVQPYE